MDVDWPDCPVEGCENKICLALGSDKCFPHTPGNKHVKRWRINARNATRADLTETGLAVRARLMGEG